MRRFRGWALRAALFCATVLRDVHVGLRLRYALPVVRVYTRFITLLFLNWRAGEPLIAP
jgi:hypothetical protein